VRSPHATEAPPDGDPQTALLTELLECVTSDPLGLEALLDLLADRLAGPCGVTAATVVVEGEAGGHPDGTLVVPLRLLGEELGALVLSVSGAQRPRPDVLSMLAHHTAVVVKAVGNRRARELQASAAAAVRRLFEEGTRATTVREAGEVLARVTAEVLGTERVAVHLSDADGRVQDLLDVGIPPDVAAALRHQVVGRLAGNSPIWRRSLRDGGPVLADDAAAEPGRPGGFIATMRLRSYVAMPLLSAGGTVGMLVCGDVSRARRWSERDRQVAHQLALQGALVVDSARLRQSERAHLEELRHRADHDALTGLPNRRRLLADLTAAMAADAGAGALLILDLDGFKKVNDRLGHHAGDELLCEVARRLRREVRAHDVVARLGGDEFAVLLADTSPAGTEDLADRLRRAVREPVVVDGVAARVGVSVGSAALADHAQDVTGLLHAADTAMYAAKHASGHASKGGVGGPTVVR
jgi:diguanylate cyclase (GGDEF)-like protein